MFYSVLLRTETWELLLGRCRLALGSCWGLYTPPAGELVGRHQTGQNRKPRSASQLLKPPEDPSTLRSISHWMGEERVHTGDKRGELTLDNATAQGFLGDGSILNPKYISAFQAAH